MPINFDDFAPRSSDDYVKFIAGEQKALRLDGVKQTVSEVPDSKQPEDPVNGVRPTKKIPSIEFGVSKEDDQDVKKLWTVTSKRLVNALKPMIEKGFENGKTIEIKITQKGTGYNTYYEFCEVVDGKDNPIITTKKKE